MKQNIHKKGFTTNSERSWSWTGWPLRNINISNNHWSFSFYIWFFFLLSPKILDYEKQELPTLREHPGSHPVFWWIRVAIILVLCFMLFFVCLSSCCVLYPFFTFSVLSNVYLKLNIIRQNKYENTKEVINRKKKKKWQTMIYKTPHRKLKIK